MNEKELSCVIKLDVNDIIKFVNLINEHDISADANAIGRNQEIDVASLLGLLSIVNSNGIEVTLRSDEDKEKEFLDIIKQFNVIKINGVDVQ